MSNLTTLRHVDSVFAHCIRRVVFAVSNPDGGRSSMQFLDRNTHERSAENEYRLGQLLHSQQHQERG